MLRAGRLLLAAGFLVGSTAPSSAAALRIQGSTTVNPVVAEIAAELRAEGLDITVDTLGGSSGGLAALGEGLADVAMSSRPLSDRDRKQYPATTFYATTIGYDALALVVSKDLWDAGIRSLSTTQIRGLYEGRFQRWSELGGPDHRVVFFNKEPGRGTWEVFAHWLYGSVEATPLTTLPEVGSNEEARNKVGSTRGAITQLSAAWADGESTFAIAVEGEHGKAVAPTRDNVLSGLYPLTRPLLLVTDGSPRHRAQSLVERLLTPRGQAVVERHGFLGVEATPSSSSEAPK